MQTGPSPPSRGAWIEILKPSWSIFGQLSSPPSRGAWIEIVRSVIMSEIWASPPSRGAWIEIVGCSPKWT